MQMIIFLIQSCVRCILSILFILVGIFAPDKLFAYHGADDKITAIGIGYTRTFLMFTPFFMCNYIVSAYVRNDNDPSRAMLATLSEVFLILCLIIYLCFR